MIHGSIRKVPVTSCVFENLKSLIPSGNKMVRGGKIFFSSTCGWQAMHISFQFRRSRHEAGKCDIFESYEKINKK